MKKEDFKDLLNRYLEGKCTEQEKAMLEAWYLDLNEGPIDTPPERIREIGEEIFRELPGNNRRKFNTGELLLAAAAVSVIMISLILEVVFHRSDLTVSNYRRNDVPPGGNRAILTLSGGMQIDLAKAGNGNIAVQQGVRIIKNAAGQLDYRPEGIQDESIAAENNIATPAGGFWEVHLPDGTKVWLNNSSSLTYPASFRKLHERRVRLEGEAYFEVAKDKSHPFIVSCNGQEVSVLGTHFNINSFSDEQVIKTSLLEGSVSVSYANGQFKQRLAPNEQCVLNGKQITVRKINAEQTVAWKNGFFRFDNCPIRQVMRELARWYNIEVSYDGPEPVESLSGRISRSKNISQVLMALEATKTVHFKVEGRRVTVMK